MATLTPGEVVFINDYTDATDTTVTASNADSGWCAWGDYLYLGGFCEICPDSWTIID